MNVRHVIAWLRSWTPWLLLSYVTGSSLTGLTLGVAALLTRSPVVSGSTLAGDVTFWAINIPADLVFVAASIGVAVLATRNGVPLWLRPIISFGGTFATYELSLAIVIGTALHGGGDPTWLVVYFGYPGLIFAGLTPFAWRLWRDLGGDRRLIPEEHHDSAVGPLG